jgi:hypothetical protein
LFSSSFSKFCIEDEDDDENEGATDPFIVPPTQRLRTHWIPPSPAVGENARRYDALFTTGEDARLQITFGARRFIAPFRRPNGAV